MKILPDNLQKHGQTRQTLVYNGKIFEKQGFYEQKQNKNNANRPAQAISFSGSAVSAVQAGGEKLTHKLINFVYENEAAYTAIYSLLFAGILKPLFVLKMPGSDEKDKQYIATKNFLQAFIGSFLGLTVGGGFVKKAIDVTKNNLKLIVPNRDNSGFVVTSDDKETEKLAISSLKKEKSGLIAKYKYIKKQGGVSSFDAFIQALTKKAVVDEKCPENFNPDKEVFINLTQNGDIKPKIKELKETAQSHLKIFNRPKSVAFVNKLKTSGNEKLLLEQKDNLIALINSDAPKEKITESYQNLSASIKDMCIGGKTGKAVKEKVKEIEPLLNKTDAQAALDSLFDFIKDKKAAETLMDTYESVWRQSTGWLTAICKSKISSLLLPTVTAALFFNKNAKKVQEKEQIKAQEDKTLVNSPIFNKEKTAFNSVMQNNKTSSSSPSFTGTFINALAKGVESLSLTDFGQAAVNKMHKLPPPLNKTSARMGDIESAIITTYWVQNTTRSKRIEPDQKLGLNIQNILVTLVSSTAAFILDTALDPLIKKSENKYKNTLVNSAKSAINSNNITQTLEEDCKDLLGNKTAVEKLTEVLTKNAADCFDANGKLIEDGALSKTIEDLVKTYGKKLTKFKSLTIFTAVVRFLIPVLMVPISGKVKQMIKARKNAAEASDPKK